MEHEYTVILDGWWGQESALISKDCLLYELKNKTIKRLLDSNILESKDIDNRNQTPHVRVTDKKTHPKDENAYRKINGQVRSLSFNSIDFHRDWIDVNLGHSGIIDTHMTIVYKKGIIAHKENVSEIIKQVIDEMMSSQLSNNSTPNQSSNTRSPNNLCTKCIEAICSIKQCHCHH